jgi:8-oxo-dGTP diphosphatase
MISVVCAIIEDETGRFLLAKRPEGKCLGGFWEFPGGKLEEGESIEAAFGPGTSRRTPYSD